MFYFIITKNYHTGTDYVTYSLYLSTEKQEISNSKQRIGYEKPEGTLDPKTNFLIKDRFKTVEAALEYHENLVFPHHTQNTGNFTQAIEYCKPLYQESNINPVEGNTVEKIRLELDQFNLLRLNQPYAFTDTLLNIFLVAENVKYVALRDGLEPKDETRFVVLQFAHHSLLIDIRTPETILYQINAFPDSFIEKFGSKTHDNIMLVEPTDDEPEILKEVRQYIANLNEGKYALHRDIHFKQYAGEMWSDELHEEFVAKRKMTEDFMKSEESTRYKLTSYKLQAIYNIESVEFNYRFDNIELKALVDNEVIMTLNDKVMSFNFDYINHYIRRQNWTDEQWKNAFIKVTGIDAEHFNKLVKETEERKNKANPKSREVILRERAKMKQNAKYRYNKFRKRVF